MCIRDSAVAVAAIISLAFHPGSGLSNETRAALGQIVGADPVSYTHLRAHETVLDLVCRLLLEKKKTSSHPFFSSTYVSYTPNNAPVLTL